jgi:hypothetical protein
MKTAAKTVKAGHAAQPRATNRSALKAVIAPKPMLLSAAANPGTHTEPMTFMNPACGRRIGATPFSGTTQASVRSGSTAVVTASPANPKRA